MISIFALFMIDINAQTSEESSIKMFTQDIIGLYEFAFDYPCCVKTRDAFRNFTINNTKTRGEQLIDFGNLDILFSFDSFVYGYGIIPFSTIEIFQNAVIFESEYMGTEKNCYDSTNNCDIVRKSFILHNEDTRFTLMIYHNSSKLNTLTMQRWTYDDSHDLNRAILLVSVIGSLIIIGCIIGLCCAFCCTGKKKKNNNVSENNVLEGNNSLELNQTDNIITQLKPDNSNIEISRLDTIHE